MDTGAILNIVDGGTPEAIRAAISAAASDGDTFALVGLFDHSTSTIAAQSAKTHGIPISTLSHHVEITRNEGPVWRAFPTPPTVARTLASTAISRGGQRDFRLHGQWIWTSHEDWFRRVWLAAEKDYLGAFKWTTENRDFELLAQRIARQEFDVLFLPTKPADAAQLLRHLAAEGIWARGTAPRFAEDENMREVTIMATPEWYDAHPGALLSHYGDHVLIPTSYAAENAEGQIFSQRISEQIGRQPSTNLAIILDSVRSALETANELSIETGISPLEAIEKTTYRKEQQQDLN